MRFARFLHDQLVCQDHIVECNGILIVVGSYAAFFHTFCHHIDLQTAQFAYHSRRNAFVTVLVLELLRICVFKVARDPGLIGVEILLFAASANIII